MKVFILTEGGKNIGFGHLTRCLSLCQAFEDKGILPEFIVNGDDSVKELLKSRKHRLLDWIEDSKQLFDIISGSQIVVIDSYLADLLFYQKLSKSVETAVYIDDNERLDYPRGVLVNGTIYAEQMYSRRKKEVRYLIGAKYIPLRKEFWQVEDKKTNKSLEKIMITFGGDDSKDMTLKILDLLTNEYPGVIKNIVVGKSFKNIDKLQKAAGKKTNLIRFPDARAMKNLMLESDLAVTAAGQTLYELARVGVPAIAVAVARNQMNNVKGWQKAGFIEYAGWWQDKDVLSRISRGIKILASFQARAQRRGIGNKTVDGKGAQRVVEVLLDKVRV